jgi:septal ring factor EnvC (AmiA/AmiB activator)
LSLPRLRGTGQHRGKSPAQLRRELDQATCDLVALATRLYEVTEERTRLEEQLDAAGIELSGVRLDLCTTEAELAAVTARLANATAITVPPAVRDTSHSADQATQPINVRPLWDAPVAGPVRSVPDPAA